MYVCLIVDFRQAEFLPSYVDEIKSQDFQGQDYGDFLLPFLSG